MAAALPENEVSRLQALRQYAILDTADEQAYDDITRLASYICEAPIALISLIDSGRQWFKSRIGISGRQTPREQSFCAHAILKPFEVMIVNDATRDERFAANPLVTGDPHIRFYAGAPLVVPTGEAIGTVCVIDRVPRHLDPRDVEALAALSRQVVAQLELRKTVAELLRLSKEQDVYHRRLEDYQQKLEAANTQLEEQSTSDGLTGIKNRRGFQQHLEHECARSVRMKLPLSLLLIDVDHFKGFNDQFGHTAGDEVLRQAAMLFQKTVRACDLAARYGGEEFAVILPNTGCEGAIILAERVRRAIEGAAWAHRPVTISVGAATVESANDGEALIAQADKALYRSKELGRNRSTHANYCQ